MQPRVFTWLFETVRGTERSQDICTQERHIYGVDVGTSGDLQAEKGISEVINMKYWPGPWEKVFATQARGPEFDPSNSSKKPGMLVQTCNPSTGGGREAEKGSSLRFVGQSAQLQVDDLISRKPDGWYPRNGIRSHL